MIISRVIRRNIMKDYGSVIPVTSEMDYNQENFSLATKYESKPHGRKLKNPDLFAFVYPLRVSVFTAILILIEKSGRRV